MGPPPKFSVRTACGIRALACGIWLLACGNRVCGNWGLCAHSVRNAHCVRAVCGIQPLACGIGGLACGISACLLMHFFLKKLGLAILRPKKKKRTKTPVSAQKWGKMTKKYEKSVRKLILELLLSSLADFELLLGRLGRFWCVLAQFGCGLV